MFTSDNDLKLDDHIKSEIEEISRNMLENMETELGFYRNAFDVMFQQKN